MCLFVVSGLHFYKLVESIQIWKYEKELKRLPLILEQIMLMIASPSSLYVSSGMQESAHTVRIFIRAPT
jgi:hypothetical protein